MANLWKPEAFQGVGKKENYFEGWYFKSVDRTEQTAYAVIPGVSISKDPSKSHAFIMLVDARNQKMYYFKYACRDFWVNEKKFEMKIGKSYFSLDRLQLDMDDGVNKISAELKFKNIYPWPVTLFSPGTMGWYAFVPMMECF